jgi:hypothetical protein
LIGLPRELRHNMRAIYCENRNGATLKNVILRTALGNSRPRSAVVRARLVLLQPPGPFVMGLGSKKRATVGKRQPQISAASFRG